MSASNRLLQGVGKAVRADFPIFEHATYLNSCSQGALSLRVRAAVEEWLEGWDEKGAEWEFLATLEPSHSIQQKTWAPMATEAPWSRTIPPSATSS